MKVEVFRELDFSRPLAAEAPLPTRRASGAWLGLRLSTNVDIVQANPGAAMSGAQGLRAAGPADGRARSASAAWPWLWSSSGRRRSSLVVIFGAQMTTFDDF